MKKQHKNMSIYELQNAINSYQRGIEKHGETHLGKIYKNKLKNATLHLTQKTEDQQQISPKEKAAKVKHFRNVLEHLLATPYDREKFGIFFDDLKQYLQNK